MRLLLIPGARHPYACPRFWKPIGVLDEFTATSVSPNFARATYACQFAALSVNNSMPQFHAWEMSGGNIA